MMNFNFSTTLCTLDVCIFIILLFGWNVVLDSSKKCVVSRSWLPIYFIFVFILSLFGGLDWDYYSYNNLIDSFLRFKIETHMEPVYFKIANFVRSYFLWRAVIWGISTWLMVLTLKRFHSYNIYACIFITIFYLLSFYKLRSSLGTAIFFYGSTFLIINTNKSLLSKLLGITLIIFSLLFHKGMIFSAFVFLILSIIPITKKTLSISIILFPFALIGLVSLINYFFNSAFTSDNREMQLAISGATSYLSREATETTLIGKISNILTYSPIYLGLFISFKQYFNSQISTPKYIGILLGFWYITTYFASLFLFEDLSSWLFIRFLTMGYFPMAIVLGYYYKTARKYTMLMKLCLCIGTLVYLFNILYTFYNNIR